MTKTIRLMLMALTILSSLVSSVQGQGWKQEMSTYILAGDKRNNADPPGKTLTDAESREAMAFITQFVTDTIYRVRATAIGIAHDIAMASSDTITRQLCIQMLLNPIIKPDQEIAGTALSFLTHFRRDDFSAGSKESIRSLIKTPGPNLNDLMKLAGFLQLNDLAPNLRAYTLRANTPSTRWAALLGLARMGDESSVSEVLQRVQRLDVTDDVVYNIFPDLVYTRRPEAIAYLASQIATDGPNCFSADAEREAAIPCAYRILEQLAPVIEGFPIEVDESGDLITSDLPATLELALNWFNLKENYTIKNDKY